MWLSDRRPPSAVAAAGMHRLRTKIKKRSAKYSFYQPRSKRKDAGSERVDWVFVGFPSASSSASQSASNAAADLDNAPLTFEPLRRPPSASADLRPSASSQFVSPSAASMAINVTPASNTVSSDYLSYHGPLDPEYSSRSWTRQEPLDRLAFASATAGYSEAPPPLPPPIPPRGKRSTQRPPPPRPASLYASLNRVTSMVQPNPADEYAQIIRGNGRKRPKSSEMPSSSSGHAITAAANLSSTSPPPPIPRHMHGTGVPFPLPDLPDSPPAPPLPPHATPSPMSPSLPSLHGEAEAAIMASIMASAEAASVAMATAATTTAVTEEESPPPPLLAESLRRDIDSPFYRRPMSLASGSLARSLSMQSKASSKAFNRTNRNDSNFGVPFGASLTRDHYLSSSARRHNVPMTAGAAGKTGTYDSVHVASSSAADMESLSLDFGNQLDVEAEALFDRELLALETGEFA